MTQSLLTLSEFAQHRDNFENVVFIFLFFVPGTNHSKVRSRNVGGLQSISISIAPHEAPAGATPHTASSDSHSRALLFLPRAVFCRPSDATINSFVFEYINSLNPDRRTGLQLGNKSHSLFFSHPRSGRHLEKGSL